MKQAGTELGQAQYEIGELGKLMPMFCFKFLLVGSIVLLVRAGGGGAGDLENKANSARWGLTELGNKFIVH